MTNEEIIIELCTKVFKTDPSSITIVKRLMGGMSNYTYVIQVNGTFYTFRIPGKKAEKFVDRQIEKYHIDLIDDLGLNNKTIYLDEETGYKIAHYIEGTPLHELDPLKYLTQVAEILHKLHNSNKVSMYDYDPIGRLKMYENHTFEYHHVHSERYNELKKRFLSYTEKYMDRSRLVFAHGDSQVSNFVVSDDSLSLMDWEFAGNNDPFYDLACFGNSNFDHALALLPVYLGKEPSVEDYNRLYFFRSFQCLQWHNVALYKEFIGLSVDLGVDFLFVANLYLDKADRFLNEIK
ncbi:MAG: phosphotransferase family protein [Firmicutes bacterium]|nr:phosphotransferase family protein [Bacillota bacterium]